MATRVAELHAVMDADIGPFDRKMDSAHAKLGQTSSAMSRVTETALGFLGGGLIGSALGSVFDTVKGAIIGTNASLEQSNIAFTTMLGSAEKAGSFLKDLQQFAKTTPFEFPDLVDASKKMLAFGFSADTVRPLLTSVGDAVAAVGGGKELIGGVTMALGQMQAKGKVASGEMLQLAERGIPSWDMLAKKMGVDIPAAMKQVEKGLVPAQVMIEAFMEGVGERFPNMMAKQARTFDGAMSTIQDALNMTSATAFAPFFGMVSEGTIALADFLASEDIEAFAQSFASGLQFAIDVVKTFADALDFDAPMADMLTQLGIDESVANTIEDITRRVQGLMGIFTSTGGDRAGFFRWLGLSEEDANAAGAIMDAFQVRAQTFIDGLLGVLTGFGEDRFDFLTMMGFDANSAEIIAQTIDIIEADVLGLLDAIMIAFDSFSTSLLDLLSGQIGFDQFLAGITEGAAGIGASLDTLLDDIGLAVTNIVNLLRDQVGPIAEALLTWGTEFTRWLAPQIPGMLSEALALATAFMQWIIDQTGPIAAQLLQWGLEFVQFIRPHIIPALGALGELLAAFVGWIFGTGLPAIQTQLLTWGRAFVEWVGPNIGPLLAELGGLLLDVVAWIVGSAVSAITSALVSWVTAFTSWVADAALGALRALNQFAIDLFGWISNTAAQMFDRAAAIGMEIVGGVVSGITRRLQDAITAVHNLGAALIGAAQSALDSRSPSEEFAAIGEDIVDGLAFGIKRRQDAALLGIEEMVALAIDVANDTAENRPSRAMEQVGMDMVEGMVQGIDKRERPAVKAVEGFVGAVIQSAQVVMDWGGEMLGSTLVTTFVDTVKDEAKAKKNQVVMAFGGEMLGNALVDDVAKGSEEAAKKAVAQACETGHKVVKKIADCGSEEAPRTARTLGTSMARAFDTHATPRMVGAGERAGRALAQGVALAADAEFRQALAELGPGFAKRFVDAMSTFAGHVTPNGLRPTVAGHLDALSELLGEVRAPQGEFGAIPGMGGPIGLIGGVGERIAATLRRQAPVAHQGGETLGQAVATGILDAIQMDDASQKISDWLITSMEPVPPKIAPHLRELFEQTGGQVGEAIMVGLPKRFNEQQIGQILAQTAERAIGSALGPAQSVMEQGGETLGQSVVSGLFDRLQMEPAALKISDWLGKATEQVAVDPKLRQLWEQTGGVLGDSLLGGIEKRLDALPSRIQRAFDRVAGMNFDELAGRLTGPAASGPRAPGGSALMPGGTDYGFASGPQSRPGSYNPNSSFEAILANLMGMSASDWQEYVDHWWWIITRGGMIPGAWRGGSRSETARWLAGLLATGWLRAGGFAQLPNWDGDPFNTPFDRGAEGAQGGNLAAALGGRGGGRVASAAGGGIFDRPTPVIVGDNARSREIVTPEHVMTGIVSETVRRELARTRAGRGGDQPIVVKVYLDSQPVAGHIVQRVSRDMNRQY